MTAIFSAYLEEQTELCAKIGRAIALLRTETDIKVRDATQADAEANLTKAEELLQQMTLESRSAPKAETRELQAQVKTCRSELGILRSSLKQAVYTVPRCESALGGSSGDEGGDTVDQRARLLKIGERVQEGTSKLQQAHRTALETEEIGINILGDLRAQRETITHAAGTLQRANEGLMRSKRTLATIGRRALANKLILYLLIALLSGAVFLLLWVEMFGFGSGSAGASSRPNATRQ